MRNQSELRRQIWRFFFFSSRRRHTRSKRDWSSDVCSSDLRDRRPFAAVYRQRSGARWHDRVPRVLADLDQVFRSEERRVGKECRLLVAPCEEKERERNRHGANEAQTGCANTEL